MNAALATAGDDHLRFDHRRAERIGLAEAVYAEGKTLGQLGQILRGAEDRGTSLLLTRLSPEQAEGLRPGLARPWDYEPVSRTAFYGEPAPVTGPAQVAVVSAGTTDAPVALEAVRTLRFAGQDALAVPDVGVAGLWRVWERVPELRTFRAVIVVAGMDGALPSVVGGLVPGLVIAVPSPVGYGVAAGGKAALHAALASCAPGVVVVNVGNGYGAACAALRTLHDLAPARGRPGATAASEQILTEVTPNQPQSI